MNVQIRRQIVGSKYLWEYDAIRAVGPITVDPTIQSKGAGRYASLGVDVKEPLVMIEGELQGDVASGIEVVQ